MWRRHPENLWREQFDADFDLPSWEGEPRKVCILASTPRSGSHLFGHAMQSTGHLGAPLEYFHKTHWEKWQELAAAAGEDTLRHIIRRRTSPNGLFAAKMHYSHIIKVKIEWRRLFEYPNVAVVRLKRRNVLRQAISFAVAEQTLSWIGGQPVVAEPSYSHRAIARALRRLVLEDASWDVYLAGFGFPTKIVFYEDFVKDMDGHIRDLGAFLGLEDAVSLTVDRSFLPPRQATSRSDEWEARFIEETRATGNFDPLGPSLMKYEDPGAFTRQNLKWLVYRNSNMAAR